MSLCSIECANRHRSDIKDVDSSDSISLGENPFFYYSANQDSIFELVENRLIQYIDSSEISTSENAIERYNLVDSLLHKFYDSDEPINNDWQLYNHLAVSSRQTQFLNYYLLKHIITILGDSYSNPLYDELELTDSLETAIHRFLKTHIDNAGYDGNHYLLKYYNLTISLYNDRNESLKDLYFSLNDVNYRSPTKYMELPNKLFNKEFRHIKNDLIPRVRYPKYDEIADRNAIDNVQNKWNEFIAIRKEISKLLPINQHEVWINSTYRFQRSLLIILKNEFEGLGYGPEVIGELILQDTCSYQNLLNYSNFSAKWNEYLKQP